MEMKFKKSIAILVESTIMMPTYTSSNWIEVVITSFYSQKRSFPTVKITMNIFAEIRSHVPTKFVYSIKNDS